MHTFLLVAHDARTDAQFPLEDLPGAGGRMDLVARCIASALLVSHGVRRDTELRALLMGPPRPPRLVRFVGAEIRGLNPDERSTGALLRKATGAEGLAERSVHPGVYVSGTGLEEALAALPPPIVLLAEDGEDLRGAALGADASFVLSDHRDLTDAERTIVVAKADAVVSVGPSPVQADHVIAIVHNELDRRG